MTRPVVHFLAMLVLAAAGPVCGDGGHDPFDSVESLEAIREVEREVTGLVDRVRPTVVMLRLSGQEGSSTGSGVVISPDGLVATCGHVGDRAGRRVTATTADGRVFRGRTLGQANMGALDCGLIKLDTDGESLASAPLGTSRDLAPGDWLVVLGYTQGPPAESRASLARVGRVLRASDREILFDAPIDAGDSGGPGFNLRGEVVMISSRCGRQPWENAATPVDRLRERMAEFAEGLDEEQMRLGLGDSDDDVRTRFTRGGDRSGRMAVQRALPLDEVVGRAEASMLRILDGSSTGCYATVIDAEGHAVSKRSQLPKPDSDGWLRAEDRDGASRRVRIVGTDGALDLALLETEGAPLPPIPWELGAKVVPGQVLLTPRFGPTGPALGFAAIERRESERDWRSGPYLGVRTEPVARADAREAGVESAVRVLEVVPDAPASRAGVKVGDLLVTLDGQPLSGREGLRRRIYDRAVGDRVRLDLLRRGERMELEATLATRGSDGGAAVQRGNTVTPISAVSTGFGEVIAHDAIVWPEQCGGPIVDLDGRAVGLNIARYDRTATHALDPVRVEASVRRMREAASRAGEPTQPAAAVDVADPAP